MAIKHLSDKNPDGTLFGQSTTDKIGFYGLAVPIVKPSITVTQTATATTTLLETRCARLEAALSALGLVTLA